jgi:predicted ATPase
MVARVTGGRTLPAEVMKQIVAKTDGNPLFVEELTKTVLEAGILVEDAEGYRLEAPLPPLAIPATLQDSLMSRLDRLAPVREIGQIGAAIGRDFSYSLLREVAGRDETALTHALVQLEQAELVFRRGEPPEAVYSFKHALVRDAAYESLLKSRRQQLHGQIARALEERFADIVASQPEIAAHHFTEAGLVERAVDYWLKAGQHAARRSANAEALNHLARWSSFPISPTGHCATSRSCCFKRCSATRSARPRGGALKVLSGHIRGRSSCARRAALTSIPCRRCLVCGPGISFVRHWVKLKPLPKIW